MPPHSRSNPDKLEIDTAHSHTRTQSDNAKSESEAPRPVAGKERHAGALKVLFQKLGPGLITGASDDDPSGIATYSQVGAQFGYGLLWTMVLTYPLMTAIQEISAPIGRVTGIGIAVANVFNLGADIGAMAAAAQLVVPGKVGVFTVIFGVASLAGVLLVPYSTYAKYLKWLTLSLFAYVAVVFCVHVSWRAVVHATVLPHIQLTKKYLTALIAVLGTTISPYLFFWQASQEVEEVRNNRGEKPLKRAPLQAPEQLAREVPPGASAADGDG
jgi:Mn2+/Fe2+ NRAMP family transporter